MAIKQGLLLTALLGLTKSFRSKSRNDAQKDCYSIFDGQTLLKFNLASPAEVGQAMARLEGLSCTEMSGYHSSELLAICGALQVEELKTVYGKQVDVLSEDAGNYYRTSSGVAQGFAEGPGVQSSDFYANWRTYETRLAKVEALVASCGGAAKLEQIGSSVEGRAIMAVRFRGAGWSSGSPRVVVDFELHAREWIVGMAGVYALEKTCEKLKAEPGWLSNTELILAPAMNPDGVIFSETDNRMWRKNRADNNGDSCKGVDLNRNWEPAWGGRESTSSNKCSDVYFGSSAFSEPEARALKSVLDEAPVAIQLDVHSYGNLILAPNSYERALHPRRAEIDVPGLLMKDAVEAANGASYTYGGSEALYPASGVCPDYITSKGGFGYTYELRPGSRWGGGGFAPPASEILPAASECFAGILAAISWAQSPYTTEAPPTPAPTPTPTCPSFAASSNPDFEGDCRCSSGICSTDGRNANCPTASGGLGGWGGRYFFYTCTDCMCI